MRTDAEDVDGIPFEISIGSDSTPLTLIMRFPLEMLPEIPFTAFAVLPFTVRVLPLEVIPMVDTCDTVVDRVLSTVSNMCILIQEV